MKLTAVLTILIGTLILACSSADVPSADPTPNVDATVEARVDQEPVTTPAVDTPTPTPILPPTADFVSHSHLLVSNNTILPNARDARMREK